MTKTSHPALSRAWLICFPTRTTFVRCDDNGGLAVDNIVRVHLDIEAVKAVTVPQKPA